LKRLLKSDVPRYQKRGDFDEHLVTLNSQVYGDPYIYRDTYLAYHDSLSKMLWLTLFELKGHHRDTTDRLECIKTAIAQFEPKKMVTSSPEKLELEIGDYLCENVFFDRDFQIKLDEFDEQLRGGFYEDLRYRVNNAVKRGYKFKIGRELTSAHTYICAFHMSKRRYNLWDYQLFLRLGNYVRNCPQVRLFNVFLNDALIGFDVVDFLGDTMATPLGFYFDYPSLADFLMHNEILYAKQKKFRWLDVGWACNPGLEEFKKKWKAVSRFNVYVQEYNRRDNSEGRIKKGK